MKEERLGICKHIISIFSRQMKPNRAFGQQSLLNGKKWRFNASFCLRRTPGGKVSAFRLNKNLFLYWGVMDLKKNYFLEIEALLRSIPALERELEELTLDSDKQQRTRKALQQRLKRLEHLTPFRFRLALYNLCKETGVNSSFIQTK